MRIPAPFLPLFAVVLACASCKERGQNEVIKREGNPDFFRVDETNTARMDAAIDRAKGEIDTFIKALQNPTPTQSYLSVKKPFPWKEGDATNHEHIWLSDVTFQDGQFHGRVANEPVDVLDVKLGDQVTCAKAEASDWMIIDDDHLVGGYTILALRDQMPPDEQKEFEASLFFKLPSPSPQDPAASPPPISNNR